MNETARTGPLHPADPKKHRKVLVGLLRRILNSGGVTISQARSLDYTPLRTTLEIGEWVFILDEDEVAAIAIENNRAIQKRKG